jgi:hypothetical protein
VPCPVEGNFFVADGSVGQSIEWWLAGDSARAATRTKTATKHYETIHGHYETINGQNSDHRMVHNPDRKGKLVQQHQAAASG